MEHILPRGWESEGAAALGDEELLTGSQVRADPTNTEESLILVTPTRFLHVTRTAVVTWPIALVGIADLQDWSKGQHGGISILTEDGVHRFIAPNRDSSYGCDLVADEVRLHTVPAIAGQIAELAWWDAKPAWPRAAIGRIAGGTLGLDAGQEVSVGLGRRGVSLYRPGQTAPFHQVGWPEVTGITIEMQDELKARLGPSVVRAMGLLQWRFKSRGMRARLGLEGFIGVSTKTSEFYIAGKATATDLRSHWDSVLQQFELEPDEVLLTTAADGTTVTPGAYAARKAPDRDVVEELERLSALHDSGALSDAEYKAAKASILGRTG